MAPEDEFSSLLSEEFEFYRIHNLDRKGKNPLRDFLLLMEYVRLYKRLKPNLVVNYTIKPNIYGTLACGLLGIPSISVVTGLGHVFIKRGFLQALVSALYRLSFSIHKQVVFLNSEDLTLFGNSNKFYLLNGEGINTDFYSPQFCKNTKEREYVSFLFLGRFLKGKGIYELVETGKRLWKERQTLSSGFWVLWIEVIPLL